MYRRKLCFSNGIYKREENSRFFINAMRENVIYHREHCQEYKEILEMTGFIPEEIKTEADLERIPFLPTMFYKTNQLSSMAATRLPFKVTSSGTTGRKSQISFNLLGLTYAAFLSWKLAAYHKLISRKPTNYILLGYEPNKENQTMISTTQWATTLFARPRRRVYALKYHETEYQVDFKGIKDALYVYSRQKAPVRFIGFPAYMWFLLQELKENGLSYQLPKGSMVLLGGGWKGFYKDKVEKEVLYQQIEELLGIPEENCREFFGVAEHPMPYCSCSNHHFHVSKYTRVIIRDVHTLQPVASGEMGLVNLLSPLIDSMPLNSIMTDDLGVLHAGGSCGCGIETPYLEILGRVGMKEIQTCGVSAAELFNRQLQE